MELLKKSGSLPIGLLIAGERYKHFVMREAELGDMIDAEVESGGPGNAIHYNAQLAVRQLVSVTSDDGREFKGPFVLAMIKKRADFLALRKAQMDLDDLGNGDAIDSAATGTLSS